MPDDLILEVGGVALSGWTGVRVTRGIERMPSDFSIELTEFYPGDLAKFKVATGKYCVVKLGDDPVVTGYIDRVGKRIDRGQHSVAVAGRGKCADLTDCSAEWPGGQFSNTTAFDIATKLAQPYGTDGSRILVLSDVENDTIIPVQNLIQTETPYQIIERVCRFAALMAYENADGNLMLTRAGGIEAASGVAEGKNVQRAEMEYSVDQRYSEIYGYIQSFDSFRDSGDGGNLQVKRADPNISRHRQLAVIAEPGDSDFSILTKRVEWEIVRRWGRSQALRVTIDSWRDADGTLWEPNTLLPIDLPSMDLSDVKWLLTEVTYSRDLYSGTTADLVLMPPEAFLPQPLVLMPGMGDVKQQGQK